MGALASFLLGLVTYPDLTEVVKIVWNPTVTFVAIIIMSLAYDELGLFESWAARISRSAGGSGKKLFFLIMILGSIVSALFANDGAALVMTPVVFSMLKAMKVPEKTYLAFIFSIGFISDTASMPFTISNLVNILTTQYFSISFIGYLRVMVIPDIVSISASSILLFLYFRKSIPERMSLPENFTINRSDSPLLKFAPIVLSVLVIAYAITGIYGIPVSLIALPFSLLVLYIGHRRKEIQGLRVLKASPWQIVLFSVGMYIVVFGLSQAGLTNMISDLLELIVKTPGPSNYVLSGYLFAFLASTMNNLPSVMIGNLSISALGNHSYLVYANVLANDIGPKFTPIGSLATLLWMDTLRRKEGIPISAAFYMKTGFIMALPVLTLSLLSLMLVT